MRRTDKPDVVAHMALKDGKRAVFRGRAPDRDFVRRFFQGGVSNCIQKDRFSAAGGVAEYRQTIKGRLKHWRKLANLSQAQAARLAGVARSTWQAWEDPARDALPDVAALAAVADGCRIEPGAALEWLVTEHRAQETASAAAPMIGSGLRIEANGF